MTTSDTGITLGEEVAVALAAGGPVVALETTLVTHGLPAPFGLRAAARAEAAVRSAGAIPATVGVFEGTLVVGLTPGQVERLAALAEHGVAKQAARGAVNQAGRRVAKLAAHDLPWALAERASGGTTVSATVFAAHRAGVRLFATGGIGGVHRGLAHRLDVSSDLGALARHPVAVVSSGAKSILDLPSTLELLEALSVPVWGYRTDELPAFYVGASGVPLSVRVDTPEQVADWLEVRFDRLGQAGVLVANPPPVLPGEAALDPQEVEAVITLAVEESHGQGVAGPAVTPFVLSRVAERLGSRAIETNIALVESNARLAGEVAVALARRAQAS